MLNPESKEVGETAAGYITKTFAKRSKCFACYMFLATDSEIKWSYLQLLPTNSLTVSPETLT